MLEMVFRDDEELGIFSSGCALTEFMRDCVRRVLRISNHHSMTCNRDVVIIVANRTAALNRTRRIPRHDHSFVRHAKVPFTLLVIAVRVLLDPAGRPARQLERMAVRLGRISDLPAPCLPAFFHSFGELWRAFARRARL